MVIPADRLVICAVEDNALSKLPVDIAVECVLSAVTSDELVVAVAAMTSVVDNSFSVGGVVTFEETSAVEDDAVFN